jgi:four helix bundle protein
VNYEEWEQSVPETIRADVLWRVTAYRLALFLLDIGWHDVERLGQDHRTRGLADQLSRSLGSIGANLAEGYSRSTGKERAHFYEYALGSARESRHWCYGGRHILGNAVIQHRCELLEQIIRLSVTMIPQQRKEGSIRETGAVYEVAEITASSEQSRAEDLTANGSESIPFAES